MPAKRCGASRIRSARLRAFLLYSDWVRALQLRSGVPVAAGADHQLEEEVR